MTHVIHRQGDIIIDMSKLITLYMITCIDINCNAPEVGTDDDVPHMMTRYIEFCLLFREKSMVDGD